MKKTMKALMIGMIATVLSGCAYFRSAPDLEAEESDRRELVQVQRLREDGQFKAAQVALQGFQLNHKTPRYVQAARLEEGRILESMGSLEAADAIYKDVRDKCMLTEPEIALRAEWRMSFVAEALGDDVRALSHAMTVEKNIDSYPELTLYAEVPARKGLILYRLGRYPEAEASAQQADRHLRAILTQPGFSSDPAVLARIYLDMGLSQAPPPSIPQFMDALRAQRLSQKYLLRALRYKDDPTSQTATKILRSNIGNLWNAIATAETAPELDAYSRYRDQARLQRAMAADLLEVLNEAVALKPADEADMSQWEAELYGQLESLAARTNQFLLAKHEEILLTPESMELNDIRRVIEPPPMRKR